MKMAVLLDPLQQLKPYKDTSIGMIQSAEKRGLECFYFHPSGLKSQDAQAFADISSIKIRDVHKENWAATQFLGTMPLTDFDIILMRKDPPFNLEYIYCTYVLDLAEKNGVLVANRPQGLRDVNEKFFTLNFPQCCPSSLVSQDMTALRSFWMEHQNVIYKPLDGMGGSAVFHVTEEGRNLSVILEVLTAMGTRTVMAQRYLPEIATLGDKRILLVNGKPVSKALARIPASGELRGNLAAGAVGKVVSITERDRWICHQLEPVLQEKQLYFAGIDVIGDYLTEINVTSPTCAMEIAQESGLDITGSYIDFLINQRSS